jgi:acylphosphatase
MTNRATIRIVARVSGRVQGVYFRASAQHEAQRRGLAGWARNEADGCVLIDVEGEVDAVDDFLAWCAKGPPRARVAAVETTRAEPAGYQQFTIRRSE